MKLKYFQVKLSILAFIWRTCLAEIIIETLSLGESVNLVKAAVKILESCYQTGVNEICIVGNSSDSLIASLSSEERFRLIILDKPPPITHGDARSRVQIFVIMVSTSTELQRVLFDIKNSRFRNHEADFYIIESPANKNGCTRAYEFLWTAWTMDLLEAKYICADGKKRRFIYSFNPYTSHAPEPWNPQKIYPGVNNHPWTLLVRQHSNDRQQTCKNMIFDKTKDLGGYQIRLTVQDGLWNLLVDANKTGTDALSGVTANIVKTLLRSLNATVKLLIHESEEFVGFVDGDGRVNGVLEETFSGISDISLSESGSWDVVKLTSTFPHYYTGLGILTRYRGQESQLMKIVCAIDITSRVGLLLVFIITVIFLKYFLDQAPVTAVLNTLRLFSNSCLIKLPAYPASRTYLASLLFFIVTIQGIYQGQLASLLSKRVLRPNIDTMEDLAESDHTIYGFKDYRVYFGNPAFEGRFVGLENYNCTECVLRDSSAACIRIPEYLIVDAARFQLHLSMGRVVEFASTWVIRQDWPLERKINTMVQSLVDADVFQYSYSRAFVKQKRTIEIDENEDRDQSYKVLSIDQLLFAFVIFGFGLVFATISFVIEMVIGGNKGSKIAKARRSFCNRFV